jgi:hypothetical protein
MKHLLLLAFIAASKTLHAQSANDSTIKVVYANNIKPSKLTALYVNGKFAAGSSMLTLDLKKIETARVLNNSVTEGGIEYNGQMYLTTMPDYKPNLISLNTLKFKYTNLADKHVMFMIDGSIINTDYDKYLIDESYVLQIVVDDINNSKENIKFELVKVLTKTEENIKKSKEIRIRGNEMSVN